MSDGPSSPTASTGAGTTDLFPLTSRRVPAWLMSAALHFLLLTTVALLLRVSPKGVPAETDRTSGIVLVHDVAGETTYFDRSDAASAASGSATVDSTSPADSRDSTSQDLQRTALPQEDVTGELLSGLPSLPSAESGDGGAVADGIADVSGFTRGTGSRPNVGGEVETSVFGVAGTGSKFVYVFDRSGSMEGFQGRPLHAAKQELIKSLRSLSPVQQFQIVFYNERPSVFNPFLPERPRLLFGDQTTIRQAEQFVGSIRADGGTRHMNALRLALGMAPDVVFFLTDAEQPQLSPAELAEVRRLNRGESVINAIEFGSGSYQGGENFLKRLSQQNRGSHVYVDVTRLPRTTR